MFKIRNKIKNTKTRITNKHTQILKKKKKIGNNINYLPTTFKRKAIDIFGSVFTWHSYIPISRICENLICNVQFSEFSGRITYIQYNNITCT